MTNSQDAKRAPSRRRVIRAAGALTGLAVALFGTLLGTAIGIASGYLGGKTDLLVQRVMDSMSAFPPLVLAMLFMVVLGQSVSIVILALALANSPRVVQVNGRVTF